MTRSIGIIAAAALALAGAACNTDTAMHGSSESAPALSVSAQNKTVTVGDTTTLTVQSRNTVGRNAHVEWMSTGGRIETAENGRVARISFDAPGTYTVTARLFFDNVEVAHDAVNINAQPLK